MWLVEGCIVYYNDLEAVFGDLTIWFNIFFIASLYKAVSSVAVNIFFNTSCKLWKNNELLVFGSNFDQTQDY